MDIPSPVAIPSMPSLFVPHGAPTFALQPGAAGAAMSAWADALGRPVAVLVVSAHWETAVPPLGVAAHPKTLHDYYGFPDALYALRYPASGAVSLADQARDLLAAAGFPVALDPARGLDHGAWIPLRVMFPDATVPVLTMSVQSRLGPEHHYRLGRALAPLRAAGVLIVGSGNLTHNLRHYHQLQGATQPPQYVTAFREWVHARLAEGDAASLLRYRQRAPGAEEAHPTDEHLLPFYVALGAAGTDFVSAPVYAGVEHNMLAMDAYAFRAGDEMQVCNFFTHAI